MNSQPRTAVLSFARHTASRGTQTSVLTASLMRLFNLYVGTPSVTGREHVPPGPFLICANHRSHLDSLALICGLGLADRCALLGARDYFFEGGLLRRFLALPFTLIAVERQRPGVAMLGTIQAAAAFFRNGGRVLIVFPEGSRQTGPAIGPFKRGIATLALSLGLPVLPVFIDGTERLLAKGRFIPCPGPIALKLGPPIAPEILPCGGAWRSGSRRLIIDIEAGVRRLADASG